MTHRMIFFPIILLSTIVFAQNDNSTLKGKAATAADKIESKCIEWRRDFHQHPELGNNEKRTAAIVTAHLKKLGIETKEGVGKTGVVGILKGGKPGPCIALRADMDGLPIVERVNLPFASKIKTTYNGQDVGAMHACGHDTHVAILMSVAEILSGMKNDIKGTIKFIFQPAEEGPPEGEEGGAALMVKEGVMENPKVDVIFGLHIESNIESGTIEYKPGSFMASSDWFTIKVKGKGSHGSQPWLGVDPIQISAQIIAGLQSIVSRQTELTKAPLVITVGKINGGVRSNIIPEECEMNGTIRTLDNAMQQEVHKKIKLTAEKIAEASGATAEVVIDTKTLVTYNTPELVKKMIPSLQSAAGINNVKEREWVTGAEDFSFYGTKAPSFFFYLGGMKKGQDPKTAAPHHTADFQIDESGMKTGIKAFCDLVFDYMNNPM
ncbi:MAG TPA: amidohydrolase [Chitinophagaceae bacterium]|nr:amidohydrolase [Chitinophagaceae bacterium]MBP7107805.1 amidohydrolase [Chitinophagaceae bacterium]HQV54024.1 amidohydrolase [Chitinophagaceae bacterium]HQX95733.1 amidohydrolase [Chitinophagaceae bacterium]HQZ49544.1 amidohydrolase [Chitinophagaceae bacterium]